jgi:hypothetical protein
VTITDISGGYRKKIDLPAANIQQDDGLIHSGLVSRADVEALLDHARTTDPNFEAARSKYEFRLVRSGNEVFLDFKARNWVGRFKARLGIGNERRAEERSAAVAALSGALGMQQETFAVFKERTGAATNRIAAKAYQLTVANRSAELDRAASMSLADQAPVQFQPGGTLVGTLNNALNALMRNRSLSEAAVFLRSHPGFGMQLFHQASVNRERPEFAQTLGRIADLHAEYMKAPDLAAAENFANYDWLENKPGPASSLRDGPLDGYFFPSVNNTVASMTPSAIDTLIRQDRVRPLQEGLVVFAIENGEARSLLPGDELFSARAVHEADPAFLGRALRLVDARGADLAAETLLKHRNEPALLLSFKDVLRLEEIRMHEQEQLALCDMVDAVSQRPGLLLALPRWGNDARLSEAHLSELRQNMSRLGHGETEADFAKYLFCLAALYTKISGAHGFGSEGESVLPLRFYGFMLMKASEEIDQTVLSQQELYGHIDRYGDRAKGFQEIFTADRCADLLGSDLLRTARAIDRDMLQRVASPEYFALFDREYERPLQFQVAREEEHNGQGDVWVPGENNRDSGIGWIRGQSVASGISSDSDEGPGHGFFVEFLREQLQRQQLQRQSISESDSDNE